MDNQQVIFLIGGDDDERATFAWDEVDDDCRVRCSFRGRSIEATAPDFFEALCDLREQLLADGLIPFCYGASLNVYPSPMARSMGGGLKAYRLKLGQQALAADLTGIFAEGPDIVPASVENQREYYDRWIASLRAS